MLSVRVTDIYGEVLDRLSILKAVLLREEDVPADSLEVWVCETGISELVKIELLSDGEVIFEGDVDEQVEEISSSSHTEIVARCSMARLIDNEAYPMTLVNPSAEDIFRYFIRVCGFNELAGENKYYPGVFKVDKGTSCYEVVKRFSRAVYGKLPKAEGEVFYIAGKDETEYAELSKTSILSLKKSYLRCERVSEIFLKLKDTEAYNTSVKDSEVQCIGINRVRYINASAGSSTPVSCVDEIFKKSREKSYYVQAEVVGFVSDIQGKYLRGVADDENLYVSGIRCSFDKNLEKTRLTLKRR